MPGKQAECLAEDCENTPTRRGLCESHYQQARRQVLDATIDISWEGLEAAGLALRRGAQRMSPFSKTVAATAKPTTTTTTTPKAEPSDA